jgi:hypothetical protein
MSEKNRIDDILDLLALAALPLVGALRAWCAILIWEWHGFPAFGVHAPALKHVWGLMLLWDLARLHIGSKTPKDQDRRLWEIVGLQLAVFAFTVSSAWVVMKVCP